MFLVVRCSQCPDANELPSELGFALFGCTVATLSLLEWTAMQPFVHCAEAGQSLSEGERTEIEGKILAGALVSSRSLVTDGARHLRSMIEDHRAESQHARALASVVDGCLDLVAEIVHERLIEVVTSLAAAPGTHGTLVVRLLNHAAQKLGPHVYCSYYQAHYHLWYAEKDRIH